MGRPYNGGPGNRLNHVANQMYRTWSGQHLPNPWKHPPPMREILVGVSGMYIPCGRVLPRTVQLPAATHSHNAPSWARQDALNPSQLEEKPSTLRWLPGHGQTRDVREAYFGQSPSCSRRSWTDKAMPTLLPTQHGWSPTPRIRDGPPTPHTPGVRELRADRVEDQTAQRDLRECSGVLKSPLSHARSPSERSRASRRPRASSCGAISAR